MTSEPTPPKTACRSLLLICRQAPIGSGDALAAVDVAMSFAAFEQAVSLLFCDDGVWQLLSEQQETEHQQKRLPNMMQSFALYGLEDIYAEQSALIQRQISPQECSISYAAVDSQQISALIHRHDSVMVF